MRELLQELADMTVECPAHFYPPDADLKCKNCDGTGRVARFPGLRERCVCAPHKPSPGQLHSCPYCNGKKYTVRASLEAVLTVILTQSWDVFFEPLVRNRVYCCIGMQEEQEAEATEDTPLEAATRALYRATQEEGDG